MAKEKKPVSRVETWFMLVWNDAAGRQDTMAGPKYALEDKVKELEDAGIEYTFEEMGKVESVVTEVKGRTNVHTAVVGGTELEVRKGDTDGRNHTD